MKKPTRPQFHRMHTRRDLERAAHEAALAAVPDGHLAPDEVAGHRHRLMTAHNGIERLMERKRISNEMAAKRAAKRGPRFG